MIINEELVSKAIDRPNSSKSQGLDNIHPKLLKETHSVIQKPLQIIFDKSITEGKIPRIWKNANVTPTFKKKEKKVKQKSTVDYRNFRVTFISRISDFRIIRDFLNSQASTQLTKKPSKNRCFQY